MMEFFVKFLELLVNGFQPSSKAPSSMFDWVFKKPEVDLINIKTKLITYWGHIEVYIKSSIYSSNWHLAIIHAN